ncbi:MAG: SRPBCC family protein [Acidimicrobiales bacterium]
MSRIRVSRTIMATPREVWAALEDIESHVTWMADAEAIRFTSSRRHGVGTAFACDTRVGPIRLTDHMEVTTWRPGHEMAVHHVGIVTGHGRFRIRRRGRRRSRLVWDEQLTFPLWLGGPVGAFVAKPLLHALWSGNLRRFARIVEG